MVSISIIAPFSGVGVTHNAISIANAISKKGYKVCVVDRNKDNPDIKNLGIEMGIISEESEGDYFTLDKVDYILYKPQFSLISLRSNNYDYVLLDCGTDLSDTTFQSNQIVAVSSSREWNRGREIFYAFCDRLNEYVGLENVSFIFPFANAKAKTELKAFCQGSSSKCIFTEFENPFSSSFDTLALGIDEKVVSKGIGDTLSKGISRIPLRNDNGEIKKYKDALSQKEKELKESKAEFKRTQEELSQTQKTVAETQKSIEEQQKAIEEKQRAIEEERNRAERERYRAIHDELTGCLNRAGYSESLKNFSLDNVVIVSLDVNDLKKTNDTLGHLMGDRLLTTISKVLVHYFGKTVCRTGGDEFTIITTPSLFDAGLLTKIDEDLKVLTENDPDGILYQIAYGYEVGDGVKSFDEIYALADEKMMNDKAVKKASLISPEELERERQRLLEEERLKALQEERRKEELEKERLELERLQTEKERLQTERALEEERIRQEQERLKKEKAEAERKRLEEKQKYEEELRNGLIPNTKWEYGEFAETEFEKNLSTMWFVTDKVSYLVGDSFRERVFHIFPTDFKEPLISMPICVAMENNNDYLVYRSGEDPYVVVEIDGYKFNISLRINTEGKMISNVYCEDLEDLEHSVTMHHGIFTPKHFGKVINTGREIKTLFPIRLNINGTCDCVELSDTDISFNHGEVEYVSGKYRFYFNDKIFKVIKD